MVIYHFIDFIIFVSITSVSICIRSMTRLLQVNIKVALGNGKCLKSTGVIGYEIRKTGSISL